MIRYTLKQLTQFVTAADCHSTAGAARELNVSQSSISASLVKLEQHLGGQLFFRHQSKGLIPTAFGSKMLTEARRLLKHAEDLENEAAISGGSVTGDLEIGCFTTIAPFFMPPLIRWFSNMYPNTRIHLNEHGRDRLIEGLERGEFPMALLYDEGLPQILESEAMKAMRPYILLALDHRLAKRKSLKLSEIVDDPLVLFDISPTGHYILNLFYQNGLKPTVCVRSPSLETVRGLVANGMGVSVLITRPAGDITYDNNGVVCIPIKDDLADSKIMIARLATNRPTKLEKAFWELCLSYFKPVPSRRAPPKR